MNNLEELETTNVIGHKGYSFMGNNSAFLRAITERSFVISPYCSDSYVEYDFNGTLLHVYTDKEESKRFLFKSINEINVVEVMRSDLTADYSNKQISYKILDLKDSDYDKEVWLCDRIKLTRFWNGKCKDDCHLLFVISSAVDNSIISTVHLDKPHYMDGDRGTRVYLLNGRNLLVDNDGDCPSVLLIKNNDLTAEPSDPIPRKMMDSALNLKSCFDSYKQSIFNFLYSVMDDEDFGIYERKDGVRYYVANIYTRQRLMEITLAFNTMNISLDGGYTVKVDSLDCNDVTNIRMLVRDAIKALDKSDSE